MQALGRLRVGASALLAGHVSLASEAALDLREADLGGWTRYFEQHEVADRERVLSELYHHVLGEDPETALAEFIRYASGLNAAVAIPEPPTQQ